MRATKPRVQTRAGPGTRCVSSGEGRASLSSDVPSVRREPRCPWAGLPQPEARRTQRGPMGAPGAKPGLRKGLEPGRPGKLEKERQTDARSTRSSRGLGSTWRFLPLALPNAFTACAHGGARTNTRTDTHTDTRTHSSPVPPQTDVPWTRRRRKLPSCPRPRASRLAGLETGASRPRARRETL